MRIVFRSGVALLRRTLCVISFAPMKKMNKIPFITKRFYVLIVFCVLTENISVAQPNAPYIEKESCPFECCRFGKWIARSTMNCYQLEGDTTKLAFRVSPEDTIIAETGNLHMDR